MRTSFEAEALSLAIRPQFPIISLCQELFFSEGAHPSHCQGYDEAFIQPTLANLFLCAIVIMQNKKTQ
jgi:hypothetical protein